MGTNQQVQAVYYFVMAMRIIWGTILLGVPLFLYVAPIKQEQDDPVSCGVYVDLDFA